MAASGYYIWLCSLYVPLLYHSCAELARPEYVEVINNGCSTVLMTLPLARQPRIEEHTIPLSYTPPNTAPRPVDITGRYPT